MISEEFKVVGNVLVVCEGVIEIDYPSIYKVISDASFEVEEVVLPDTLRVIGDDAFFDIPGIKRINLPSSVYRIGAQAFWGLDDLEELVIPATVSVIGKHAFCNCGKLTLRIPFDDQMIPSGWDKTFAFNIKDIRFEVD